LPWQGGAARRFDKLKALSPPKGFAKATDGAPGRCALPLFLTTVFMVPDFALGGEGIGL